MAKINAIKVDGIKRYIETIAYKDTLPTATSDSADLVSVSNTLYIKQVTDGVYSYVELTAGSDGGLTEEEVTNLINSNEAVVTLTSDVRDLQVDKQDTLVSGTNIKTINNESLLGEGNIEIEGGGAAISIVDSLPTANAENFEKGKIYTQGDLLQYITRITSEEPNLSTVANLVSNTYDIAAVAVGTNIYLFGGYYALNTINKFDTTTNTLTTLSTTLPTGANAIGAAVVGTNIYLFGGFVSATKRLNTINKFDTTTETITTLSATISIESSNIAAVAVGSNIYLFGGYAAAGSGKDILNIISKFDTTAETITTLGVTLPNNASSIAAVAVGSNIYLFGVTSSYIYKFNTINQTITTLSATLPTATYNMGAAAIGNDIYLFGGSSDGNKLSTINKFNITTETVTTLSATLPSAAHSIEAAAVGTNIYLFGGYGSSYLNTINKAEFGAYYTFETLLDSETGVTEEEVNNLITSNETIVALTSDVRDLQTDKQDTLVSGTSIKTINNETILGSGNIEIDVDLSSKQDTLVSGTNIKTINGESILGEGNIEVADDTAYVEEKTLYISKSTSAEGTTVVANNGEETTDTLSTLKVGETNYAVPQGGGGSSVQTLTATTLETAPITFEAITNASNLPFIQISDLIIDEKNVSISLNVDGDILNFEYDDLLELIVSRNEYAGLFILIPFVHNNIQYGLALTSDPLKLNVGTSSASETELVIVNKAIKMGCISIVKNNVEYQIFSFSSVPYLIGSTYKYVYSGTAIVNKNLIDAGILATSVGLVITLQVYDISSLLQ